jgi:hypothetical protein
MVEYLVCQYTDISSQYTDISSQYTDISSHRGPIFSGPVSGCGWFWERPGK